MAKATAAAPVAGPAYIRLLARLGAVELPRTPPALTARLAAWFDWNRALTLSRALDGVLPAATADADADATAAEAECAQARRELVQRIDAGIAPPPASNDAEADYQPWRAHCVDAQRAMQAATGRLRGRLREQLAGQSPAKARLAEVDAVMEATLSPRELMLLAQLPRLLGRHFHQLHAAGEPAALYPRFRQDLRHALLAELELRFHPIDGLLAALRNR